MPSKRKPPAATPEELAARPKPPKAEWGPPKVEPAEEQKPSLMKMGLWQLIKTYGVALAVYYFVFNEMFVLTITYLLHYDYLGAGDVTSLVEYVGVGHMLNVKETLGRSISLGPFTITAKFATNFALASGFMSLFTFLQVPFCIATLPRIQRALAPVTRLWRKPAPPPEPLVRPKAKIVKTPAPKPPEGAA